MTIAAAPLIAKLFGQPSLTPIVAALASIFAITPLGAIHTAILTRELRFRSVAARNIAASLAGAAVGLPLAFLGFGAWALDRLNALERSASGLSAEATGARESSAAGAARIGELRLQMGSIAADARSQAASELMDVLSRISELRRAQVAADDSYERAVIRAPQSGVVDKLVCRTVGGVVPAGQTIMELVPDSDSMVVEATISPIDIDQVHVGQEATVRFSAFSSRTTPELRGKVTHVAADRTDDRTAHTAFYRVTVSLDRTELAKLGGLKLKPGMPAETFIQTGERTMLSYIIKPLADQLARAFREN